VKRVTQGLRQRFQWIGRISTVRIMGKTRLIVLCAVIALSGIVVISIAVLMPIRGCSQQPASATRRDWFSPTKCVDENGQVMRNDDGRLQFRCIDRRALLAQSDDPQAVRELANAVVEFNGTADAPEAVLNEFEDRLTRSELKHRTSKKDGISEENIVRALNNLGQKLNAPAYARTYSVEVKLLREDS